MDGVSTEVKGLTSLRRFLKQWEGLIGKSANRLAEEINRHSYVVLGLFSCGYFAATCFRASRKLFWFDELFTVYISRLSDLKSVWKALLHGADSKPPLLYVFTQFWQHLLGEGPMVTRLPAILRGQT